MCLQDELDPVPQEGVSRNATSASGGANDSPWLYRELSVPKNKIGLILMTRLRILLVDDDEDGIFTTRKLLESKQCDVVSAMCVTEALEQIAAQHFDVLITDLCMPDPGDGFSVVTAMRHFQPEALTLVVSDYPDMHQAMVAILLQADEVFVKPFNVEQLIPLIEKRKLTSTPLPRETLIKLSAFHKRSS